MYPLNMTLRGVHTGHAVANDQAEHQALSDAGYKPAFIGNDAGAEDGLTVDALRARLDAALAIAGLRLLVLKMLCSSAKAISGLARFCTNCANTLRRLCTNTVGMRIKSAKLPVNPPTKPTTEASPATPGSTSGSAWQAWSPERQASLLAEGRTDVWDVLTRRFETRMIQTALACTRGRRIEAAQKLGIGRNTITRKIQELGLE